MRTPPLVAVTAGHLVAGLQAALHGEVDLTIFIPRQGQLVATRQLLDAFFKRQPNDRVCSI